MALGLTALIVCHILKQTLLIKLLNNNNKKDNNKITIFLLKGVI